MTFRAMSGASRIVSGSFAILSRQALGSPSHYYVETEHRTSETNDRQETARIADEWKKRGCKAETVVVDVTDESVQLVDDTEVTPVQVRAGVSVSAFLRQSGCRCPGWVMSKAEARLCALSGLLHS
jgi:hypothetical protein